MVWVPTASSVRGCQTALPAGSVAVCPLGWLSVRKVIDAPLIGVPASVVRCATTGARLGLWPGAGTRAMVSLDAPAASDAEACDGVNAGSPAKVAWIVWFPAARLPSKRHW